MKIGINQPKKTAILTCFSTTKGMTANKKCYYKIMKNLKISFAIIFILLASITISVSCSENENGKVENSNLKARISDRDMEKLKADFIIIMESNEYINFHKGAKTMGEKMNKENFTFKTREEFVEWINNNLDKTFFTSTNDAIKLYDSTINELNNLHIKYKNFYSSLNDCTIDDILIICAPELVHPPLQSSERSCANACVDAAVKAFHIADLTYEYAMNSGNVYMAMYGTIAYNNENAQITQNYIKCFGNCPV